MTIKKICDILDAKVVCGGQFVDREIKYGFASDLMSDVLTLDTEDLLLITGLTNMQTLRTAEMADVSCILFVRNKKVTGEMKEIAKENETVLLECRYSMFRTVGILYEAGLAPVY